MLDILCIGDAVLDIFLQIPQTNPHFGLDEDKNKLFIDYGYKINIESYVKDIGGNACNTAVGISRLGKNVGLCAEIGNDEFSDLITNKLAEENVNTNFIVKDNKQTSFSVCLNYKDERTLLVEHVEREHNFNFLTSSARFIYLTSLGKKWENTYQKTLDFVKTTGAKLAFNPGTLQIEEGSNLLTDLIEMTDYLFLNKQEAEKVLYGKDKNLSGEKSDIKKILFGLKSMGAKNIIVTDSYNGSYLYDAVEKMYHLEIIKVNVVEKTGAGDAFTAGFISAILNKVKEKDALVWGALNAASVVTKIGAQEGLLNKNSMEERLTQAGQFTPKII